MKNIIWGILLVIIIVGGYISFSNSTGSSEEVMESDSNMESDTMRESEKMTDSDDEKHMSSDDISTEDMVPGEEMLIGGTYEAYDPEKLALADDGSVILYFSASWCPSCRALDKNIKENISSIPNDVTILELNYDTETVFKKKYGITSQHTLVQVDADGNMIKKWSGSPTLNHMLSQL